MLNLKDPGGICELRCFNFFMVNWLSEKSEEAIKEFCKKEACDEKVKLYSSFGLKNEAIQF